MMLFFPYGGLGNQLFEYAFARAIQEKTNERIMISKRFFQKYYTQRDQVIDFFADYYTLNKNTVVSDSRLLYYAFFMYYTFSHFFFKYIRRQRTWEITPKQFYRFAKWGFYCSRNESYLCNDISELPLNAPIKYVEGFFQWADVISPIRKTLQKELSLRVPLEKSSEDLLVKIRNTESVCLHIRRGDYLKYDLFHVCNYQYYKSAMEYVATKVEKPVFFIFSNEIDWVERNYIIPYEHVFVKENHAAPFELELMRNCKHFILSNSSFSWWAQFLAEYNSSIVVAPSPWLADRRECSLYMENWYVIECSGGMDR